MMSQTGWWTPTPNRQNARFHYVDVDGVTLCKKWMVSGGHIEEGKDDHPDNCKECRRVLERLRAKEARNESV